jgi:hypothetical protein
VNPGNPTNGAGLHVLVGVRYSLPQLLREVKLERETSIFSMEKLEQVEIAKLFQKNRPRRVLKSRK